MGSETPNKRVLVVEDDDSMRRMIVEALSASGDYDPVGAPTAEKAIEELGRDQPEFDAAIVDLRLPGMSGEELVGRLRGLSPRTSVIVITAYPDDDSILRCFEHGAADYLTKPLDLGVLHRRLSRSLVRRVQLDRTDRDVEVRAQAKGWVELTAPSDVDYVERFRSFTEALLATNIKEDVREDVRVAIDEIGTNAVEWGNHGDRSKKIRLSYCIFDDRIVFKIEDEGEGFDPAALDDPSVDPLEHIMQRLASGKRPGGYGVFMTKNVMDEVIYSDRGNTVLLTKFLATGAGGAS